MPTSQDAIAAVHQHIDQHFGDHLETIRQIIRQRSISADGTGMRAMADMLAGHLEGLGARAEVVETAGYPVIYGEVDAGARRTLLIYGMYDTMPVEGETWRCDPFAAEILDLHGLGPSIVARGAENSKGPLAACLNMLSSWKAVHGKFPVNLKFVFDGEEELGSPSLPDFIHACRQGLQADAGLIPALIQDSRGKPVIQLGFKGILFLDLIVRGGTWGGPLERAVHSSRAVWYSSPTIVLVQALASLFSADQRRILIEGFYDDVAPIPPDDEALLASLATTFDAAEQLVSDKVGGFKWDLEGVDLLRKYLYEPSLNIDGIESGYMQGAKTILPHEARAKIDFRLVPNQEAEKVRALLEAHFRRSGFAQVKVDLHDTTKWSRTPVTALPVQAAIRACRDFGYEPEVWPLQAGSSPMYLFTETLGIPVVPAGLGSGGGAHGPDEYATVDGLRLCEKYLASFLAHLAAG